MIHNIPTCVNLTFGGSIIQVVQSKGRFQQIMKSINEYLKLTWCITFNVLVIHLVIHIVSYTDHTEKLFHLDLFIFEKTGIVKSN